MNDAGGNDADEALSADCALGHASPSQASPPRPTPSSDVVRAVRIDLSRDPDRAMTRRRHDTAAHHRCKGRQRPQRVAQDIGERKRGMLANRIVALSADAVDAAFAIIKGLLQSIKKERG